MLAADSALRIVGVEKQFDTQQGPIRALARTDFTVRKGEFAVLLGPSGCGKKTMLRLVAGLEYPTSGAVEISGRPLWRDEQRDDSAAAHMGIVFQEPNLFPWLSIEDNIALPLKLRGINKVARRERARKCRHFGIRAALATRVVGRHAATRRDCARLELRSGNPSDGRALRRTRRHHP
jgi:NitT/TauT family transport system ATP-binding protein